MLLYRDNLCSGVCGAVLQKGGKWLWVYIWVYINADPNLPPSCLPALITLWLHGWCSRRVSCSPLPPPTQLKSPHPEGQRRFLRWGFCKITPCHSLCKLDNTAWKLGSAPANAGINKPRYKCRKWEFHSRCPLGTSPANLHLDGCLSLSTLLIKACSPPMRQISYYCPHFTAATARSGLPRATNLISGGTRSERALPVSCDTQCTPLPTWNKINGFPKS